MVHLSYTLAFVNASENDAQQFEAPYLPFSFIAGSLKGGLCTIDNIPPWYTYCSGMVLEIVYFRLLTLIIDLQQQQEVGLILGTPSVLRVDDCKVPGRLVSCCTWYQVLLLYHNTPMNI